MTNDSKASLKGRRIFVTGASRGIGWAMAERFRAAGGEVIAPTRAELDLSRPESVREYLSRHSDLRVDVLINNAGINRIAPIPELKVEDWLDTLHTNLTAAFLLVQAMAPGMATRGWGRIVNVSSCYGIVGRAGRASYSSSKAGLAGLTRTAAIEFGRSNVLVNSIAPGFVETEMTHRNNSPEQVAALVGQTAVGRLAQPEEVAEVAFFLGSALNSFITGQTVVVDGGFSCQ